jgi:hypothetical protein
MPGTLNNPAFRAAWADWEQHRRELKKKLTPLAAKRLLSKLESWGEARAIAAIAYSIERGWTGIFEPKANNGRGANGGGNGHKPTWGEVQRAKGDFLAPDEKPVPKPPTIDECIAMRVGELGETSEAARAFILSHGPAFNYAGQEDARPAGFTLADAEKAGEPLRVELQTKRATV